MEDDLKILNVDISASNDRNVPKIKIQDLMTETSISKYLTKILNLSLRDLTKLSNTPNEDDLWWKMTLKIFLINSICNI